MTTTTFSATDLDMEGAIRHLNEHSYVLVENLLGREELEQVRDGVADLFAAEREAPFDPGDGPGPKTTRCWSRTWRIPTRSARPSTPG